MIVVLLTICAHSMNYSALLEKWVLGHMPIIVQPEIDYQEGYGLVSVFYHYRQEDNALEFHYVFRVSHMKV